MPRLKRRRNRHVFLELVHDIKEVFVTEDDKRYARFSDAIVAGPQHREVQYFAQRYGLNAEHIRLLIPRLRSDVRGSGEREAPTTVAERS